MAELVRSDLVSRPGVAVVTLDSVRNRNALSEQLLSELLDALRAAEIDDTVRAVLLRANGPAFCAGADLAAVASGSMEPILRRVVEAQRLIVTMGKPVVAEVHGSVRAGGLGLVAAADIAVASETSSFALTEVKLGLSAAVVSLTVLARMSSRGASDQLLTGRVFDGRTAQNLGVVTRAVPEPELGPAVGSVLDELLAAHPQGLRETKTLLTLALRQRIDDLADEMVQRSTELFASPEARAAVSALLR